MSEAPITSYECYKHGSTAKAWLLSWPKDDHRLAQWVPVSQMELFKESGRKVWVEIKPWLLEKLGWE